jgi:hypothetical protein
MLVAWLVCAAVAVLVASVALAQPPIMRSAESSRLAAQQIVYQQGVSPSSDYQGTSDTFISRLGDESVNYGRESVLALFAGDQRSVLLRFELDGLSMGDTIERATLSLFVADHVSGTGDLPVSIYRVLRPWEELEATWYNATAGDLWTLAGCNSPASDRAVSTSAGGVVSSAGVWLDLDITALVQSWSATPAANFGVVIKAGSATPTSHVEDGDQYLLWSASAASPPARPKLTVDVIPAGAGSPTATPPTVYGTPTLAALQQLVSPAGYSGTTDTFISDFGDPEANYGGEGAMRLRSNDHRASLIRFDLSSIDASARVYSATLHLYSQSRTNLNPLPVSAHRALRSWNEFEATWNLATLAQRWAFPGANGLTTDRSPDAFATTVLTGTSLWTHWDVTGLVQDWVADASSNSGVILKAGSGAQVEYSLVAAQYLANPNLRPRLDILYALPQQPTPPPTPTATRTATATATPTPLAAPTVVEFQHGRSPSGAYQVQDTYISREGDLAANYGQGATIMVGANDTQAALLRFDLSGITPWYHIHSARLVVYTDGASNGYPITISAHRLVRAWDEMGATWTNATADVRWTTSGANGLGSDRLGQASDSRVISTMGDWYEFDVTGMVAAWVASPEDNVGLVLKGMSGPQTTYEFISSQYQVAQGAYYRPRLIVAYTVPEGPTPTPSRTRTPTPTATRSHTYLPVILSVYAPPTTTPTPTAPQIP